MAAVASGDETALTALIDRYAASVHAYLLRHSGSREDADDLLQETWVRVARSARSFDTARRFRSWIYGIATNLARDLFRRRMTRERALRDTCDESPRDTPVRIRSIAANCASASPSSPKTCGRCCCCVTTRE